MQTTVAETLVRASPADAYAAVLALARALWSVTPDDVLDARPGQRLIHAVPLDGEPSCWLTWELAPAGPASTRVRLAHADADLGDAPDPDLETLLDVLRTQLGEAVAGWYSTAHEDGDP